MAAKKTTAKLKSAKPTAKKPFKRPVPTGDGLEGEPAVLASYASMPDPDRTLGQQLHALITAAAPALVPRLWYGMPAYANATGKPVCFFQAASKFKTRYATLGFMHEAKLDDGNLWPVAFAVTAITPAEEARIVALVKRAVG